MTASRNYCQYTMLRLSDDPEILDSVQLAVTPINMDTEATNSTLPNITSLTDENTTPMSTQKKNVVDHVEQQDAWMGRINVLLKMTSAMSLRMRRKSWICGVYLVYEYEGTSKTFLWKTLDVGIRRRGDIVLNMASSGIASLFISGRRTTHSRFHIPINIDETSTFSMANKHCFEALDLSLSDILCKSRQVLPVIPKGSCQDIVSASLKQSYLWHHCKVLKLTKNMRLTVVKDGEHGEENDGEVEIDVLEEILIDHADDPVASIVYFTYPNILDNIHYPSYFKERAILAPRNKVVDNINEHLLDKFPREEMVYLSCDSVDKTKCNAAIDKSIFSL
ncbi:ATP-dependent DNA helicase PIF1-like protein [Tanacetum coccineum]